MLSGQDVLEFAETHYEGQYLAEQYLNGTMNSEDGRRAAATLERCMQVIEKWQSWSPGHYSQYAKVFGELRDRVKAKLALKVQVKI